MIANLLGAVSENPEIVCCGGVNADVLKTLEKMPAKKNFVALSFYQPSFAAWEIFEEAEFSRHGSDQTFVLLSCLLPGGVHCLDFKWMPATRHLRRFSEIVVENMGFDVTLMLSRLCY